jgi:hypothetical protein
VQFEDDRWHQKLRDSDLQAWCKPVTRDVQLETVQSFYKAMSGKIFFHYTSKLNTFCVLANRTTFNVGNVFLETMPISQSAMVAKMPMEKDTTCLPSQHVTVKVANIVTQRSL